MAADLTSRAALEARAYAGLRPQRHVRRGLDLLPAHQRQTEALDDRGKNQDRLHGREAVTDALARAAAERKVGVARQTLREVALPAVGPKRQRLVEPARVALHHPRRRDEDGFRR